MLRLTRRGRITLLVVAALIYLLGLVLVNSHLVSEEQGDQLPNDSMRSSL